MQPISTSAPSPRPRRCKKRIWFTLGALLVYRLGTYIPLPGIDPQALAQTFNSSPTGILGMFNMFAGGAVGRMAIFALNIMPYISASIIMQLLTSSCRRWSSSRRKASRAASINQYTRYGTVVLAAAAGLRHRRRPRGRHQRRRSIRACSSASPTVVTLTGGTMFLMWLGEQITARGIGNGISLIIFAGIVANLPHALAGTLELGRDGRHVDRRSSSPSRSSPSS